MTPIESNQNDKKYLQDYILVFEDILSNEFCNQILNEYKDSNDWGHTYIQGGIIERSLRNVDSIIISKEFIINKNLEIRKYIDTKLFEYASIAINEYFKVFPNVYIQKDSGYELLRYDTGQYYVQHTDSFSEHPREISCSFALNDDYEGGEFAFWNREKKIILKKGSVLMFPSNFMYPHEIMPVTKGTRYSIVTWFV